MISVAFAVLFIGLGVDYAVHFLLRWAEEAGAGASRAIPVITAARDIGPALSLAAVTTILAFLAFTPTDFTGMAPCCAGFRCRAGGWTGSRLCAARGGRTGWRTTCARP